MRRHVNPPSVPALLLVEDDAVSRAFLSQALEALPARVDAADCAAAALAFADAGAHALWLIDANLPDASGEALLERLRRRDARTPALALTADMPPERVASLRAAGFRAVLGKPITMAALHEAVHAVLNAVDPPTATPSGDGALWDDAQAAAALGGRADAIAALRKLFLAELPAQRDAVLAAIARGDHEAARNELHKLKAGCGFVGAATLADAARTLYADPGDPRAQSVFAQLVERLLRPTAPV